MRCAFLIDMPRNCKKPCPSCGRGCSIAKKVCTCGFILRDVAKKNISTKKNEKKQCPKCELKWDNATLMCTCGHSFITGKRKQNSLLRSSPRCRGCGDTRKRHVCTAKPEAVRLKCLRSRSPKATSNKNEKPSTPSASLSNKSVSKKKSVNRVKCTVCVIRKTISTLIKNCDVAEVNVVSLEADLTNIVDQVKVFQVTIANELKKVKQLVQTLKAKTSTTSTSKKQNVFDLMRLASKKAVAPNTPSRKQQPKQSRGAQVKAGLVAVQDRLNNQFLVSLVQGQVTL